MTPTAAVIIPHYDDSTRLARCLAALAPQLTPEVEVVVVDNASPQPPDDIVAAHPGLRLVREPAKGAAAARNRGVAETTADRLYFLDCDCVPEPDWLATADATELTGRVIGGRITLFDETPVPRSGAEGFEAVFAFDNKGYIEEKGFSVTANLLTTRDVFVATGPLIVGLSEDLDWCHRATAAGFELRYEPALTVAHPTRSDWTALRRKWHRLTAEGYGVNGSSPAARAKWAVKALAMPLSILAHAPRVLRHPDLSGAERRAALATLIRLRLTRMVWMLRQGAGLGI